mmetsp:Transcript_50637/g.141798  ORF Transcript_50637/g.141798 Transcript_50637/m.141798 type:complete len:261 (+) Transcript_50637:1212-1994(+)
MAWFDWYLEGPDHVGRTNVPDFLATAEKSAHPLEVHARENEASGADGLSARKGLGDLGLQFVKSLGLRHLEAAAHWRGLGIGVRQHCDLHCVRWLGHWQRQIHHRVKLDRLVIDIRKSDLRSDLELKNVDDLGVVPAQVACPRLRRNLHVGLPIGTRVVDDWSRIWCSVHVLMEPIQQKRKELLRVVLLEAGEFGAPLSYKALELGGAQHSVRVGPHRLQQICEAVREASLRTQGSEAQVGLELAGAVIFPQGDRVGQRL